MESNNSYLERIFEFQKAVGSKNTALASRVAQAIPALVEYEGDLASVSREDLLSVNGIGEQTVGYYLRVLGGEEIDKVVAEVPKIMRSQNIRDYSKKETGNWDGSWDNAVRGLEDR